MVRITGVPIQGLRHRPNRDSDANDVAPIGGLVRLKDEPIVHRSVSCNDNCFARHGTATTRRDLSGLSSVESCGVSPRIDAAAVADDALRESRQIFQGMKLSLASEPQCRAGIKRNSWHAIDQLGVRETGVPGRRQFTLQEVRQLIRGTEKIAIHAFEIAVDPFLSNNAFDRIDRRGMTFGGQFGAAFAIQMFQFEIPLVENGDEVRRRSFGFTREDRTVVQHDHRFAGLRQEIRRGQTGHPSADDTNIGAFILSEARESGSRGHGHPNGNRTSGMGVHAVGSRNWSHGLKNRCRHAAGFSHVNSFTEHLRDEKITTAPTRPPPKRRYISE